MRGTGLLPCGGGERPVVIVAVDSLDGRAGVNLDVVADREVLEVGDEVIA